MPIRRIPKSDASGAGSAPAQPLQEIPSPRPRSRQFAQNDLARPQASSRAPAPQAAPSHASADPNRPKRGHARKDESGKWQPTGEYETGFAKPPKQHQFDGSRPGPGRPKESRSQDSYLRDELDQVRTIRIDGVSRKVRNRELVAKLMVANALEKKSDKALSNTHEHARRLYPDVTSVDATASAPGDAGLDERVLRQLFAGLALGEPIAGAADPLADLMRQPLGPDNDPHGDWGEGDWDAPSEEPADD